MNRDLDTVLKGIIQDVKELKTVAADGSLVLIRKADVLEILKSWRDALKQDAA